MRYALAIVLLLACSGCASASHHWVKITGDKAWPYDAQWQWVNDSSGRTDDCEIDHNLEGRYSVWVHGGGYGDFDTLEHAQQQCYHIAKLRFL